LQQADAALDVVGVVGQGLGHRLAHGLEAGEVDDGADLVRLQGVGEQGGVAHVAFDQRQGLAGEGVQALRHVGLAVAEVVEQHDVVPGLGQRHGRVAADVAGAAGEEDVHGVSGGKHWPCQRSSVSSRFIATVTVGRWGNG
jgi:hypothetical protein